MTSRIWNRWIFEYIFEFFFYNMLICAFKIQLMRAPTWPWVLFVYCGLHGFCMVTADWSNRRKDSHLRIMNHKSVDMSHPLKTIGQSYDVTRPFSCSHSVLFQSFIPILFFCIIQLYSRYPGPAMTSSWCNIDDVMSCRVMFFFCNSISSCLWLIPIMKYLWRHHDSFYR